MRSRGHRPARLYRLRSNAVAEVKGRGLFPQDEGSETVVIHMKTVHECLADYDTTLLRAIAERLGVELTTNQQRGMVQEVADVLLDTDRVREVLTWLSTEERQALDTLLVHGGRMRVHRFAQRFGTIRRFGPGSMAREAPWRTPASPAEGLWYRGLMSRAFAQEADTAVEFFFIPSDLMSLLPPPQADRKPFVVPLADEPSAVTLGDLALIDDMCMFLALVQNRTVRLKEDRLPPDEMEHLQAQFVGEGGPRLTFLYYMARAVHLVQVEGPRLRLDRDRVREWLKRPRPEQIWTLQEAWSKDTAWNDLWHVPGIRCEDTGWRNDPVLARESVLGLLSRCQTEAWLSIPGFVDAVRERAPDYARPNGDFESWYIRDVRTGEYLTGFEHWDQVEGALLTYLLSGPLHWLGLISLGFREGWKKPSSFRLTPWGTAFLGLSDVSPEELPPQPARVAPDGTVTLAREFSLHDRFQLSRIAEWVASGPEYVYVITPAALGRALSANIQVEMVERFLQRISEGSVPAAAVARLRSWAEYYGHVRLRHATILETRTPQLMSELRAHERIKGYLRQALSPTIVLVRDRDWAPLIKELHLAGYLPEIIED